MAEANYIQDGKFIDYTPLSALVAGQVIQLTDGRAAVAVDAIAAGARGSVAVEGIFEVAKTTSMVILPGSELYWDHSANACHLLHVNDKDFFLGTAMEDEASADTTAKVNLNVRPVWTVSFESGFDSVTVLTAGLIVESIACGRDGWMGRFDTTAEAQKVDALSVRKMAVAEIGVVHTLINVQLNGDDAAFDLNVGLANATHATDADSITESLFIHIDGNSTNINAESDDGTTEVAATDTTVDFTAGTPFLAQWDLRNLEDIQLYINGVNRLPSSVFKLNAAAGPLGLLCHMEKTSNDSPGRVFVRGGVSQFEALNS